MLRCSFTLTSSTNNNLLYGQQQHALTASCFCLNVTNKLVNDMKDLCISQFQVRPAPPLPGYCGAFARLVSPRGGAFANFVLPGGRAFANPEPFLSFWHAGGFLSENNYTEDFTGKESRLAHLSRTGKKRVVKACSWFYACISSLLINGLQI